MQRQTQAQEEDYVTCNIVLSVIVYTSIFALFIIWEQGNKANTMPDLENPLQMFWCCLHLYTVCVLVVFEGVYLATSAPTLPLLSPSPGNSSMMVIPLLSSLLLLWRPGWPFLFMSSFLGVGKTSIARSIARSLNRQVLERQGLLNNWFMFYHALSSYSACGKFGEHEISQRVARGFLSALQPSQVYQNSMMHSQKHESVILSHCQWK